MIAFLATFASILIPRYNYCYNVDTYAMTKEQKKKALKAKIENIKQTIGIQVTFILDIKF